MIRVPWIGGAIGSINLKAGDWSLRVELPIWGRNGESNGVPQVMTGEKIREQKIIRK
jgi:hypothetical protein